MTTFEIIKSNLNLVPFLKGLDIKDFILNIIMTFPLGVLLPCMIKDLDTKKIVKIGVLTGLGIELIQFILVFIQGFTFRNININDSIANFLGIYLGYKAFVISFKILYPEVAEIKNKSKFLIPIKNIFNYVLKLNKKTFKEFS